MQKANFDFEILIHDDASTDGTLEIIKEYEKNNPGLFKVYSEKENQFSKNNLGFIKKLFQEAKGKYIAVCEGDDFWTDPNKLQLQVDFLENNLDYSICFHPVRVFFDKHEEPDSIFPSCNDKSSFTIERLIKGNYIQTNSVMYRKQDYKDLVLGIMPGDWYMHLFHAQFGEIGFINRVMSSYRRNEGGVWWESYHNKNKFWKENGLRHLAIYKELLKMFGKNKKYETIILDNAARDSSFVIESDDSREGVLIKEIADKYPEYIQRILTNAQCLIEHVKKIEEYENQLEDKLQHLEGQKNQLDGQLKDIKNSRSYKLGRMMASFCPKFIKH